MRRISTCIRTWPALAVLSVSLCVSLTNADDTHDFVVHQKLTLAQALDGYDGTLEVLRDSRLTESDIKAMREIDPDVDPTNTPRFKIVPLKSAIVRLSVNGREIQSLPLEKSYANLDAVDMGEKGRRALLLTQDFSIGMGSYSGPITQILEIASGPTGLTLAWAKARNPSAGKETLITLMRSLKTAWNFGASKDGKSKDILKVSCRPNDTAEKFITTFSRYHHGKQGWILVSKNRDMTWEAEDGDQLLGYTLPDLKKFP